jgi:hypothetical protein
MECQSGHYAITEQRLETHKLRKGRLFLHSSSNGMHRRCRSPTVGSPDAFGGCRHPGSKPPPVTEQMRGCGIHDKPIPHGCRSVQNQQRINKNGSNTCSTSQNGQGGERHLGSAKGSRLAYCGNGERTPEKPFPEFRCMVKHEETNVILQCRNNNH